MTRLVDDEASILAQARRALSPTSANEQRVLQNLRAQLATPPNLPDVNSLPGRSWPLRAVGAIAVLGAVALSGGLGYRKGLEAGIAQQTKLIPRANAVVVASAMSAQPELELAPPAPRAAHERPLRSVLKVLPVASAARTRNEPPPAPSPLGLDEEVRQLRRVERAVRESNPRLALVLLEELDRAIPTGQLLEERRAASIMASCQLGTDAAIADARAFAAGHAGSAYLTRVIEICGLESERNSAAAGTYVPGSEVDR